MQYVYLHGFSTGSNSYKGTYFREKFAELGITLHLPDLNGDDFEHITMTRQLEIVEEVITSFDETVALIGSSLGGYLAAITAERHLQVIRMILIAPAFQFASRYLKQMDPQQLRQWQQEGYLQIYHSGFGEMRRLHYGVVDDALQYDKMSFHRSIPALIFHGIYDEPVPYRGSIEYLESNPEAQLLMLPTDHTMVNEVETLWRYLRLFLEL